MTKSTERSLGGVLWRAWECSGRLGNQFNTRTHPWLMYMYHTPPLLTRTPPRGNLKFPLRILITSTPEEQYLDDLLRTSKMSYIGD